LGTVLTSALSEEFAGSSPAPQIIWGWANGKAASAHQVVLKGFRLRFPQALALHVMLNFSLLPEAQTKKLALCIDLRRITLVIQEFKSLRLLDMQT
jgi:hypothetical protein